MALQELTLTVTTIEMGYVTLIRGDTSIRIPMRTEGLMKLRIGEKVTLTLTKNDAV